MNKTTLGLLIGRNREYIDRHENGEYDYTDGDLRMIAEVTGAPLDFLVNGTGWVEAMPAPAAVEKRATRVGREIRAASARKDAAPGRGRGAAARDSPRKDNPSA